MICPEEAFVKIENLIGDYWGADPVYYTSSKDKQEADCAKLCCKILEVICMSRKEKTREKILENTIETREYLNSLPKIYMVARWAGYGVQEFPFAGKYAENGVPFV